LWLVAFGFQMILEAIKDFLRIQDLRI